MTFPGNGRPNDQRGFLHKSFIGKAIGKVAKTIVPGVGVASEVVSFGRQVFAKQKARPTVSRSLTARPTLAGAQGKELARNLKFAGPATSIPTFARARGIGPVKKRGLAPPPCDFPMVRDAEGRCREPTSGALGGEQFGVGEAVMGRYGAALEPGSQIVDRAVCLRGMQLGNDGLCYNKGAITNAQRMWPRGRRPLLTGGDMRAIGIATRAGSKLDRTTKRLRALGMMKALPAPRKRPAHAHARPVAAVSV